MKTVISMVLVIALLTCGCAASRIEQANRVLASGGLEESREATQQAIRTMRFGESGEVNDYGDCAAPTPEMVQQLTNDYARTLAACEIKLNKYEQRSDASRRLAFLLAIAGSLAGSVIVPALASGEAAKSTIAAWGGFAGATNLAQRSLNDEGLDAETFIARREMIRQSLLPATEAFGDPRNNYCQRAIAVSRMAAACVVYAIAGNQAPAAPPAPPVERAPGVDGNEAEDPKAGEEAAPRAEEIPAPTLPPGE